MANKIVKWQNSEFECIEPSDLQSTFVVAQCLDNQWVPQDLLNTMIDKGLSLSDVGTKREKLVRTEYRRALINAGQVVINRAYVHNNPVVFRDYLERDENREAFKELLGSGVIVPYLFNEKTPIDRPGYTTDPRGFSAWEQVSQEVRSQCVRLSWDDVVNGQLILDQLSRRFHSFAQTTNLMDVDVLARDLELKEQEEMPLRNRLTEVATRCVQLAGQKPNNLVSREDLYTEFVTASGTPPLEGKYDKNKLFAGQIKQLLDLKYNMNLPDGLGGYGLTPVDTLPRTALQEWEQVKPKEITAQDMVDLLRRTTFSLVQGGLFLRSMALLSLGDVQEVRRSDEWAKYILSLQDLQKNPLDFPDEQKGVPAVYRSYVELAKVVTRVVKSEKVGERTARWTPVVEFVLNVGGAILSVIWSNQGPLYKIGGEVSTKIAEKGAPVVSRIIVRGFTELGAQADMRTSIDFMRGGMDHARQQWSEIVQGLKDIPDFVKVEKVIKQGQNPLINYPG